MVHKRCSSEREDSRYFKRLAVSVTSILIEAVPECATETALAKQKEVLCKFPIPREDAISKLKQISSELEREGDSLTDAPHQASPQTTG